MWALPVVGAVRRIGQGWRVMVFVPRGVVPNVRHRVMVPKNIRVRLHCGSLRIREERRRAWVDGWVGGPVGRVDYCSVTRRCTLAPVSCPYISSAHVSIQLNVNSQHFLSTHFHPRLAPLLKFCLSFQCIQQINQLALPLRPITLQSHSMQPQPSTQG